jgi:NIPSNAP
MIEELRHYVATPGNRDALLARFKNDTMSLFKRHNIEVTAFWTARDEPDTLYYLCRFADGAARDAAWKTFLADPDWAAVRAVSEKDGALVASLKSIMLESADGF